MTTDGKRLENLVAFVEKQLLPLGFEVITNERIYEDGVQVNEYDFQARGKVGTTEFAWLIECRDRPSQGAAPRSWIEQLATRRDDACFNKVTAVSTTGFTAGAVSLAGRRGIELREVKELSPESFAGWLDLQFVETHTQRITLSDATFVPQQPISDELNAAISRSLESTNGRSKVLRISSTGELASAEEAFGHVVRSNESLWQRTEPNGPPVEVRIQVNYPEGQRFEIATSLGAVEIAHILFTGSVALEVNLSMLSYAGEYRHATTGEVISQVATFAPQAILGMKFATELHHFAETGETGILLRRLPDEA